MTEIDTNLFHIRLKTEIERVGLLSCKRILELDKHEIRNIGNFSDEDIDRIKFAASRMLLPLGFSTALEAEEKFRDRWKNISFDCQSLDNITGGGIPVRYLTEISGHSGVGKTQICLQLSLSVQYPPSCGGLGAGAVYICTEDRFPSKRLDQMMQHFPLNSAAREEMKSISPGENIFVDHIADVEGLKECVEVRLKELAKSRRLGLVVVDSIAGVFRGEYSMAQSGKRASDLRRIALSLHAVARRFGLAVVCVNQMSDAVREEGEVGERSVPSLGLAWANLVTQRLRVVGGAGGRRTLSLVSSPHLPPASASFAITQRGIEGAE